MLVHVLVGLSEARSTNTVWTISSSLPTRLRPGARGGFPDRFAAVRSVARVFGKHLVPHVLVYEMTKLNWPPKAARRVAYCATPSTSSLTSRSYGTKNRVDVTRGVLDGRAFDEGRMRNNALREAEEKGRCSPRVMEKVEAKVSRRGFLGMSGAAVVGVSCGSIQSGETSI